MTQLELEFRAATTLSASFPKRQIELVVMPYETEAQVVHHGRWIREIVSRGAFDGINANERRIKVNLNHRSEQSIGRAVRFYPDHQEGLVAELQISRTREGDEALELASDGVLDASAGFGVMDDGEHWPERGLRRLTKLWLDHIAMVADPAYRTANVLAVRQAGEATATVPRPNMEIVRGWRLSDRYAMIE